MDLLSFAISYMAQKKEKQQEAKKLVEDLPELVENIELASPSESNPAANLQISEQFSEATTPVAPLHQKPPMTVLKRTILRALPFVLVSLAIFSIPFLTAPYMSWFWLKYAQVRTYILCALIWNLIGSVLYAQVDKRLPRLLIVLIFALPLITSHGWAPLIYTIEMSLRSVLSLPP